MEGWGVGGMDWHFPGSLVRGSSAGAEERGAGTSFISGQSSLQALGSFPRQPRPTAVFLISDRASLPLPSAAFMGHQKIMGHDFLYEFVGSCPIALQERLPSRGSGKSGWGYSCQERESIIWGVGLSRDADNLLFLWKRCSE